MYNIYSQFVHFLKNYVDIRRHKERYSSGFLLIVFLVKDVKRVKRGEAQDGRRLRLLLWVCLNTENVFQCRSLWTSLLFHPTLHRFPLYGVMGLPKCHKIPDRKQKKDITKCCPTVYLFRRNTRDQEIISAHTTDDLELLDDYEIVLYYSINVKIAKMSFTRFLNEHCLRLFFF